MSKDELISYNLMAGCNDCVSRLFAYSWEVKQVTESTRWMHIFTLCANKQPFQCDIIGGIFEAAMNTVFSRSQYWPLLCYYGATVSQNVQKPSWQPTHFKKLIMPPTSLNMSKMCWSSATISGLSLQIHSCWNQSRHTVISRKRPLLMLTRIYILLRHL